MPQIPLNQAMQIAVAHHEAGRVAEAEQIYRQILSQFPSHADALHLLGVLSGQSSQFTTAVDLITQAIAINPQSDSYYTNLGNALEQLGRRDEAIAAFNRALELNAQSFQAQYNLANSLSNAGRIEEAISAYSKTIDLNADFADAHFNLGKLHKDKKHLTQAIGSLEKAVRINPNFAAAWNSLGNALFDSKQIDRAITAYNNAILLQSNFAEAYNNLGGALRAKKDYAAALAAAEKAIALKSDLPGVHINLAYLFDERGQFDRALAAWQAAIAVDPRSAEAHTGLAVTLHELGRLDEAVETVQTALQLNPNFPKAHCDQGIIQLARGNFAEAITSFQQCIKLDADNAMPHLNLAIIYLLQGDFDRGLSEYEWRWKAGTLHFDFPKWQGEPLEGKTIVLHAEQGIGDTIQFVRYASLLAQRGAKVILSCQPTLMRLLAPLAGIHQVVSTEDPICPADYRCPLLSLPSVLKTRLETIPAPKKYIAPPLPRGGRAEGARLSPAPNTPPTLQVGLAWAGNPDFRADHRRSIPLSQFAPLAAIPNIQFHSLQTGPAAQQPSPLPNLIPTPPLIDFADTAALIDTLDLVISVDTAVAHLSAAMGKPTWLLIPFIPDWRWLLDRSDSPWYPTMRLYRQKTPGDWTPVIQSMTTDLLTFSPA